MKALMRAGGTAALSLLPGTCAMPMAERGVPQASAEPVGVQPDGGWSARDDSKPPARFRHVRHGPDTSAQTPGDVS